MAFQALLPRPFMTSQRKQYVEAPTELGGGSCTSGSQTITTETSFFRAASVCRDACPGRFHRLRGKNLHNFESKNSKKDLLFVEIQHRARKNFRGRKFSKIFRIFWKCRNFSKTRFFENYWNSFENRKIKFSENFDIFKKSEKFSKIFALENFFELDVVSSRIINRFRNFWA